MFSGRVAGGDWLGGEEDAGLFSVIVDTAHLTLDWDRDSEARELAGPGPGPWPAPVTRPPDPRCPLSLSLGPVSGPGVEAGKYRKKHFAREVWMRFNRLQINQVRFRNTYVYENKLLNLSKYWEVCFLKVSVHPCWPHRYSPFPHDATHVDTWSQPPASPTHRSQNTGKLEWQQLRRQVISVCRRNYVKRVRLSRFPEPERAWSWPGDSCWETMKVSVIFSLPAIEHEGTRSNTWQVK